MNKKRTQTNIKTKVTRFSNSALFSLLFAKPPNETVEKLLFQGTSPGQRLLERPDPRFEGG
jgi:hypothetical protein